MTDRIGSALILPVILTVTIGTMLNNYGGNNRHELKNFAIYRKYHDIYLKKATKLKKENLIKFELLMLLC